MAAEADKLLDQNFVRKHAIEQAAEFNISVWYPRPLAGDQLYGWPVLQVTGDMLHFFLWHGDLLICYGYSRYPKLAHNLVYHPIATMSTMGF